MCAALCLWAFGWQSRLGASRCLFHVPIAPRLVEVWKRDTELPGLRPDGCFVPFQRQRCTRDAGTLLAQSYQLSNVFFTPLLRHGLPSTVAFSLKNSAGPAEKFPVAPEHGTAVQRARIFAKPERRHYLGAMPTKQLELPPEAALAFLRDMRSFFAAKNQLEEDEIAAAAG